MTRLVTPFALAAVLAGAGAHAKRPPTATAGGAPRGAAASGAWVLALPLATVAPGHEGWQRFGEYRSEAACRAQRAATLATLDADPSARAARRAADELRCVPAATVEAAEAE